MTLVSFADDLSTGVLVVTLSKSKAQLGVLAAVPNTSFVKYVDENSDDLSFKFIFDDATISANSGDEYGVETL